MRLSAYMPKCLQQVAENGKSNAVGYEKWTGKNTLKYTFRTINIEKHE